MASQAVVVSSTSATPSGVRSPGWRVTLRPDQTEWTAAVLAASRAARWDGLVAQPLSVRRVADHQALLTLVRARGEGSDLALVDLHPLGQPGQGSHDCP